MIHFLKKNTENLAMAPSHDLRSQVSLSSGYSLIQNHYNLSNRSSLPFSYAQAVKNFFPSQPQEQIIRISKKWIESRKGRKFCFRCGDLDHIAKQCRDPIGCFDCGIFGHKRKECTMLSVSTVTSSSSINHGFLFVLKFLSPKGLLLEYQWHMRDVGIKYLEELLYHFDIINELNTGIGYEERFGNPEDYFGKSDAGVVKGQISTPSLINMDYNSL